MKKSTILLIALAFIVAGVVLGFLMWPKELTNNGQPANTNQPSVNQPITNNPEPTATTTEAEIITSDIDTSDWQAYRNEEWGFEVKYPREWRLTRVKTGSAEDVFFHKGTTTEGALISVHIEDIGNDNNEDIKVVKSLNIESFENQFQKTKKVKIGNVINTQLLLTNQQALTLIRNNNYLYKVFFWPSGAIDKSIYDAFLLSFKFTN